MPLPLERLTGLRADLAALDPNEWANIDKWPAAAKPLIRTLFPYSSEGTLVDALWIDRLHCELHSGCASRHRLRAVRRHAGVRAGARTRSGGSKCGAN
jgi:hypothetical protein